VLETEVLGLPEPLELLQPELLAVLDTVLQPEEEKEAD
jgi:hypothetical protein